MNSAYFDVDSTDLYFSYVIWAGVQGPGTFIKENRQAGFKSRENVISYSYDRRGDVASPQTGRPGPKNFWFDPSTAWNKLICVVEQG